MTKCPNGHGNPDGQHFCGECGSALVVAEGLPSGKREHRQSHTAAPRAAQPKVEPGRTRTSRLRPKDLVRVVAPGDDHDGHIGTIYALLEDGSGVCVKFSGDSDPYAFGFDELELVPTHRPGPALGPTGNNVAESTPRRPASSPAATSNSGKEAAVAVGVCVLVVIGLFMSMQSVSLMTGSGPVWMGVAVVAAGTALAFFMGAAQWVRILAAVLLALSLANAFYIENEMSNKRDEITQIFDG